MSKGTAQSTGPQTVLRPQLTLDRVFVAAYAKNISTPENGWEAAAIIGTKRRLAEVDWTVSVSFKTLLGMSASDVDRDAVEVALAGSRKFGSLSAQATIYLTPNELGSTGRSFYGEANLSLPVTRTLNLVGALGVRTRELGPGYTSASAGVSKTVTQNVRAELRYFCTNKRELGAAYRGRVVVALRATF